MSLYTILKINENHIKDQHDMLDKKMKHKIKKYSKNDIKLIKFYRGMGFLEMNNRLLNNDYYYNRNLEFIKELFIKNEISIFQDIEMFKKNTIKLFTHFNKKIEKKINHFLKLFNEDAIKSNKEFVVYRATKIKYPNNVFTTFTSTSLLPILGFCGTESVCHMYVITVPTWVNFLYFETSDKKLDLYSDYSFDEYEICLPPMLEFKETKTKNVKIIPSYSGMQFKKTGNVQTNVVLHYVTIVKQHKFKLEPFIIPNLKITL